IYEAADGRFVALAALEEKFWHNFCRAVGREDWETLEGALVKDHPEIYEEIKALFLTRTQAEWSELGMEVDCCLTAVEEMDSWADSLYITGRALTFPQLYQNNMETMQVRTERSRQTAAMTPPPECGQDTYEVLQTKLQCTPDQLARYVKYGIIPEGVRKS
ncbi:CoA transferase, partial [Microbacteriaceae bacterium K1510]|nr:CoA transferase [Microbacteriaceae bacterium K1510]